MKTDMNELDGFLDRFRKDVLPNLEKSAFVLVIAPTTKNADLKVAIEVGSAILLDKPLIVFKSSNRPVSFRLLEIADHVIEGDLDKDHDRMFEELRKIFNRTATK